MDLDDLLLTKEEVPILHKTCFRIPILKRLLSENLEIHPGIAKAMFFKVAHEFQDELREYWSKLEERDEKNWIGEVFLSKKMVVKSQGYNQEVQPLIWRDETILSENGLVGSFSISRNAGGTLYFNTQDMNCSSGLHPDHRDSYINFSAEKAREFGEGKEKYIKIFHYAQHNIDHLPGALFLRNWALEYMNEVFRHHYKELF